MLPRLLVLQFHVLSAGMTAAEYVERALSLLPGYNCTRALILDTVLGPAENFEYASTTTPPGPPPAVS